MTALEAAPGPAPNPAQAGAAAREDLAARYRAVRATSVALAAPLAPEDQQVQSMPDCSPAKWHLGHVSWFFETFVLGPYAAGHAPFHPDYGYVFNSYYEQVGPRHARPARGLLTRPPLADVMAYRAHVDDACARLIETSDDATLAAIAPLVTLGLHHEQQHQELLLTDIKHAFASQPLFPAYRADLPAGPPADRRAAPPPGVVGFAGGVHAVGHDGAGFAFDNETPRHEVLLADFRLAARPVTNGEFLDFIEDGGYRRAALWLADGWAWVEAGGANLWGAAAPMYWRCRDGAWEEFTLAGWRPLDRAAPACHLSYFEADAYARCVGARLPSEAEWEVAARLSGAAEAGANLLAAGRLHPAADMPGDGTGAGGLRRMFGDVWEWTASAYQPYPGFRPAAGAVGEYNGKFMVSQLVLRGGSCATPPGHIRASYRNFFYPHQSWQFTGLRLAADA